MRTAESEDGSDKRTRLAMALADNGFDDVVVLRREEAGEVLTEKRCELIDYLETHDPGSVRALAEALERDKGTLSRDLALLADLDIVDYERRGNAKAPRLATTTVVVEPIV